MLQRSVAFVLTLGFALGVLPALRADERSDKLVGTWVWRAPPGDHDQYWAIANDDGKWTIKGWYKDDKGVETGSFVGIDVKYADGALNYTHRYIKKNFDYKDNVPVLIKLDGAFVKYYWDPANVRTQRILEKQTVAKGPGTEPAKDKTPALEPFKNALQAKVGAKVVGTWKAGGRFDEYWTVAPEGASFKVTGAFWKNGKEVGSAHGTEVSYGKESLTFRRVFDKKPDPKLGDSANCIFKITDSGVEFIVGAGFKAKGELLARAEAPMAVAKEGGKPADPTTASSKYEGKYLGVWTGSFGVTNDRLSLSIIKSKNEWIVEGFVTSADNKRLAYFRELHARTDVDGKSMTFTPTWVEQAPPIVGAPALMLTPQPSGLRAELSDAKMAVVVELAKGDLKQYTQLKPPAAPKGKAAVPPELPGGKKLTVETFKLPRDIPPAKPFAVLDAKQQVMSLAVSPDGKRVAVGSQQTLTGGFTADLAVWDIEQQKQVWIKKKMAAGDLASVQQLAFSGDGKILIARPAKFGEGETLRFYGAETGLELKSPPPLKMSLGCVAWHPTKLLLAVGTAKAFYGQLELIDPRTGKSLWTVSQVHKTQIDGLAFSPDGETIATFGRVTKGKDYCVKLFESAKGALIHEFPGTPNGIATSVAFSGDGKFVAALFGDLNKPAIVIWDMATKEEVRRITDMATGGHSSRHNLAFLADNKTLAVSCWDRHLHLFDVTTGQRTGVYPRAYGSTVSDVYAVGDGQMLLTNRETEGLLLWKQSDVLTQPTRESTK